jgi:hypothetical protein
MYHRFPTRAALCGELWLRTEERFHSGLTAALATSENPQKRCVAAARFTVQWCRGHPVESQVLLTGHPRERRGDRRTMRSGAYTAS